MSAFMTVFAVVGIVAVVLWIYWVFMHTINKRKQTIKQSKLCHQ